MPQDYPSPWNTLRIKINLDQQGLNCVQVNHALDTNFPLMQTFLRTLLLVLSQLSLWGQSYYIPITDQDLMLLNGREKPAGLFDEGAALFNAAYITNKIPQTRFHASYNKIYSPQDYLIHLEDQYRIDSFYYYDGAGKDSFEVFVGNPGEWTSLALAYTNSYNTWKTVRAKGVGTMLLIRFYGPQAELGELIFYGEMLAQAVDPPQPRRLPSPLRLREFMGINAFVDDPVEAVGKISGLVREYHNWDWHYAPNLKAGAVAVDGLRFAPAAAGNWNFDQYYQELQNQGLKVYPCLQGSPPWLQSNFDYKPISAGLLADDPKAYRLHSRFVWQYVARYGSRTHVPSSLNLAQNQPQRSGLNLIDGLETWNEPDKWWRDRAGYFHPFEYAAMLSADYDGHNGTLGPGHGLKGADPNMPFIMGGLAGLDTNYLEAIRLWSLYQRPNKNFPADVLNFHHYSNDAGGQDDRAHYGIPPEDDSLQQRLEHLVNYRNRVLTGKKIFLSEFGYDSNPGSIQAPAPDDSLAVLEAQANFLVRAMILAHASGIDGAFVYMFRDVNAPNPNKYMSSGLTAEKWNQHRPKPAYYKMQGLMQVLGDYICQGREQANLRELYIYRYLLPESGARAYVIWTKSMGRKSSFRELYFLDEEGPATAYRLSGDAQILKEEVPFSGGQPFEVNNSPVILIFP